jgi:Uma2 family endonuclease
MPDQTTPPLLTADQLQRLYLPRKRTELIRGSLRVREAAGFRHGEITATLALAIGQHVMAHGLGLLLAAETGFKLESDPDTVRAPDIAFIRRDRRPVPSPTGFAELAPDLVVEVLSPEDRPGEVLAKVGDWLNAGTRLVWVVDPKREAVRVYRLDGSETVFDSADRLLGEDVLPGFEIVVTDLFQTPAR